MSIKKDETSNLIENWVKTINRKSPINISFITQPITNAITSRIRSLESIYGRSSVYRFLTRKGLYPLFLFTTTTGVLGYSAHRAYQKSTQLFIHLLAVIYPTYCCWKLVRDKNFSSNQDEDLKSWLIYWLLFSSFQVLDHFKSSDLFMFSKRKYDFYKLIILYWAQSPHSQGAQLLYKYVIQKPLEEEEQSQEYRIEQVPVKKETYRIIDGYLPPHLSTPVFNSSSSNHSSSSSSSDDDSFGSNGPEDETIQTTLSLQKESYPLLPNTVESAW